MKRNRVHTPAERLAARRLGEYRARVSLVQLICTISILRTALTRVLPLTGCAAWWTALLCLLPGAAAYALGALALRLTGTNTLLELARRCLGQAGGVLLSLLLAALLLLDGAASLTALVTLFTQGVGTRGTQLTLALLTCGVLLFSLNREGLPRAVHLLRWVLLAAAAVAAAFALPAVKTDSLFPMLGEGMPALRSGLMAGAGLGWPLLLLLTIPAEKEILRATAICPVVLAVAAALLALTLTIPHEELIRHHALADVLLLPARFSSSAVKTLMLCLTMLAFFLGIGGNVQLGAQHLTSPLTRMPRYLPHGVLLALTLTQALDTGRLWQAIGAAEPWLLLPPAALLLLCLLISIFRRKRT